MNEKRDEHVVGGEKKLRQKRLKAAVFLDRDDTLIHNSGDLGDPEEVELIQGAASAIASLRGLGYMIVVVTNQGGVARGKYGEDDVVAVHQRMSELLAAQTSGALVDAYYYCPYHPQGKLKKYKKEHVTRKPQPGMLLEAAEDLGLDLSQSWMVGDQMRDVQAGAAAGTRTVLIRADADRLAPLTISQMEGVTVDDVGVKDVVAGEETDSAGGIKPDFMAKNVVEAVRVIAQQRKPETGDEIKKSSGKRWDAAAVAKLQKTPAKKQKKENDTTSEAVKDKGKEEKGGGARPFKPWSVQEEGDDDRGWVKKPARLCGKEHQGKGDDVVMPKEKSDKESVAKTSKQKIDETHKDGGSHDPQEVIQEAIRKAEAREAALKASVKRAEEEATRREKAANPVDGGEEKVRTVIQASGESEQTLRQILKEVRQLRGVDEMTSLKMFAVVLQMIAVLCLVGGLWMGAGNIEYFVKWIGVGVMIELGTIVMLLIGRK